MFLKLPTLLQNTPIFEGFTIPNSEALPLLEYYIGEDIILTVPLSINGKPLDDTWEIKAVLKSLPTSATTLWNGNLENGLAHKSSSPLHFAIVLPKSLTSTLAPGTFWLDVLGEQRIGTGTLIDQRLVFGRIPICFNATASGSFSETNSPPIVDITKL